MALAVFENENGGCLFLFPKKEDPMSIFESAKQSLIMRQVAEMYGIRPVCHGMAVSSLHRDQKHRIKPHIRDPTEFL